MTMELITHKVQKGDYLIKIAKNYGFDGKDWKKIYNHAANAQLKKKRPNPNSLWPGDEVKLPKYTLEAVVETYDAVEEALKQHVAMAPPVAKYWESVSKFSTEVTKLKKKKEITAKEMKKAEEAYNKAQQAYMWSLKWISACRDGTAGDPKFAGTVACIPEHRRAYAKGQKRDHAQRHFNALKSAYEQDSKAAKKAADLLVKEMQIIMTKLKEWQKRQDAIEDSLRDTLKILDNMKKQTF